MSKFSARVLAAFFAVVPVSVFSDSIPLTIRAPLPQTQEVLPVLPDAPAGFRVHALSALPHDEGSLKPIVASQMSISAFGISCVEKMDVTAGTDAVLHVEINAPCRPYAQVEIVHAGLSFSDALSYAGTLRFELPAMEPDGVVSAHFGPNQGLKGADLVGDLGDFTRLAIAWGGGPEMSIEASPTEAVPMTIHRFGIAGGLHILSYRARSQQEAGVVRLALGRQVAPDTCALGAEGSVLRLSPDHPPLAYNLKLAAPGCDRIGEMFLLKNILQDLKLAGR